MAALVLRRSRTCLFPKNSSSLRDFHVSFSLFFSTGRAKQQAGTPSSLSELLIHRHHFSPETASRVASVLTRTESLEKADSVLSFLKETGFSTSNLEKIASYRPGLLSVKLEKTMKPKIRFFQDFGFTPTEIIEIVSKAPLLLTISVTQLTFSLPVLKGLLGSTEEVAEFIKVCGLRFNQFEKNLLPNVEFLKSCGVPTEQFVWCLNNQLLCKPEMMKQIVQKVDDLGFDRRSRKFIYAVRAMGSMSSETWDHKLKTLGELGFSEDDILRMFRYAPLVFTVSGKKMEQVTKVVVETGKYEISSIVNIPTVLSYSIEKRFRPRLRVLRILDRKNLIKEWPTLGTLIMIPDDKFFEKFVAPYVDEVGGVWNSVRGKGEAKLEEL